MSEQPEAQHRFSRKISTGGMKARTSGGLRKMAKDMASAYPEMAVHQHLTDAARELDAGRTHSAQRHVNAAIFGLQPLQLRRHGVHDDAGHMRGKAFMQQAHRHLLLVKDIEDIHGSNSAIGQQRRDDRESERAMRTQPQTPATIAAGWENISRAIELATFAGAKPGSGKNFAKLKGVLAKRGARDPGALAAYIGRRKYGRKKFARLGSSHASQLYGIELVGPKGYIHGWIRASAAHLEKSGGGAYLPEHVGFGHQMTPKEHRRAAAGHLHMMSQAPAGSAKANLHHKFAKMHAAVALGGKKYERRIGKRLIASGKATAFAPKGIGPFASDTTGIELVGPKGYRHGWIYEGGPGLPAPKARKGRFFLEGKQVPRHEFQQRMNVMAREPGAGAPGSMARLKTPYPSAGLPRPSPVHEPSAPMPRIRGWISHDQAAQYDGKPGMRGDLPGGGVVMGTYNHHAQSITDRKGQAHKVMHVDPTAYQAGARDISHLDPVRKATLNRFDVLYRSGAVGKRLKKTAEAQAAVYSKTGGYPAGYQLQFSWSDIDQAIELAGPKGFTHGWIRALNAGSATEAAARGAGFPLGLKPHQRKAYTALRKRGHSHGKAYRIASRISGGIGKALNAGAATRSATNFANPEPPPFRLAG